MKNFSKFKREQRVMRGRALYSDAGYRRGGDSVCSSDSNISYLRFRYDNSFDAPETRIMGELCEDVFRGMSKYRGEK